MRPFTAGVELSLIDLETHFNPIRAAQQRVKLQQAGWRQSSPNICQWDSEAPPPILIY